MKIFDAFKKKKEMRVISVFNQKGGVGKTTTVVNLASALGFNKKKVLVIDMDPQGNSTSGLGVEDPEVTVNGKKEVLSIKLTPEVVDPDDIEMLQDLIITAINEANRKAQEKHDSEINKITGGINIPGL